MEGDLTPEVCMDGWINGQMNRVEKAQDIHSYIHIYIRTYIHTYIHNIHTDDRREQTEEFPSLARGDGESLGDFRERQRKDTARSGSIHASL